MKTAPILLLVVAFAAEERTEIDVFPDDPNFTLTFAHWISPDGYLYIESTLEPKTGTFSENNILSFTWSWKETDSWGSTTTDENGEE